MFSFGSNNDAAEKSNDDTATLNWQNFINLLPTNLNKSTAFTEALVKPVLEKQASVATSTKKQLLALIKLQQAYATEKNLIISMPVPNSTAKKETIVQFVCHVMIQIFLHHLEKHVCLEFWKQFKKYCKDTLGLPFKGKCTKIADYVQQILQVLAQNSTKKRKIETVDAKTERPAKKRKIVAKPATTSAEGKRFAELLESASDETKAKEMGTFFAALLGAVQNFETDEQALVYEHLVLAMFDRIEKEKSLPSDEMTQHVMTKFANNPLHTLLSKFEK